MCRIAAYLGPPRRLDQLLLAGDHSLVVQSYRPREMAEALMNADGFGVAWYGDPSLPEPALYRTAMPLWGDDNFPRMAPHLVAGCVLANVRSATPGFGISTANVSPFVSRGWAFVHNGYLQGFRDGLARALRQGLGDDAWNAIEGHTDSEHLFALFLDRAARRGLRPREGTPEALADTLAETLAGVSGALEGRGRRGLLNVAITDGDHLAVGRHAVAAAAPSLYARRGGAAGDGEADGVLIASEPLFDDPGWSPLPPGEVRVYGAGGAAVPLAHRPLPSPPEDPDSPREEGRAPR
jgi:glutamine amidotransferase